MITQQQVEDFLKNLRGIWMPAAAYRVLVELLIEARENGDVYWHNYKQRLAWGCHLSERSVANALRQLQDADRIAIISQRHIRVLNVPAR